MKRYLLVAVCACCLGKSLLAQDDLFDQVKNADMSIPSSPAFALLGVNPETILRPSDLRSFKVDWRLKNYILAPDFALEGQPFWHFYYKKKSFQEYANSSYLAKKLSTLSLSLGTAKIDGINHAAYALKTNLYTAEDPLTDKALMASLTKEHNAAVREIQTEIDTLRMRQRAATDGAQRRELQEQMNAFNQKKKDQALAAKEKYRQIIEEFHQSHWNRTMVDAAFGMVYTFDNNGGADSFKIKNAGMAFWVNGALQMGNYGLLTGIARYSQVKGSGNSLLGAGFRYGDPRFNFFVELVFENLGNFFDPNQANPFGEDEVFADKFSQDLGSGWLQFNNASRRSQYTISYGGDFRLSRNVLLNFALRTQFTHKLELSRLLPVANIICLMK